MAKSDQQPAEIRGESVRVHRELSKALRVMHQALSVADRLPVNHVPTDAIRLAISQVHVARSFFDEGVHDA
jgi:hypothetical protein